MPQCLLITVLQFVLEWFYIFSVFVFIFVNCFQSLSVSEFRETLSGDTLGFNLTETITTLMQLREAFNAAGEAGLVTLTDSIISDLESIRDTQLGAIEGNVELLERQVDQLSTHIDTVVVSPVA